MSGLVEIKKPEFDVEVDIRYATANNFTGKAIYDKPYCSLHPDAAAALTRAIVLAREIDRRLVIFDAYRPHSVQWALWNHTPDPNFISHPETGSLPHCRGVAVDLNLLDSHGKELDMGTGFDEFSPKSYHGNIEISREAQQNRFTLMGIMTSAGWDFYRNEWWHYQLFKPREYPIIDKK